jgi:predicted nucleic-acid-binding protein
MVPDCDPFRKVLVRLDLLLFINVGISAAPQAQQAAELIEAADQVHVSTVVLFEVVWLLARAWQFERNEVVPVFERLVSGREIEVHQVAARTWLRLLEAGGDFADGVILDDMQTAPCARLRKLFV